MDEQTIELDCQPGYPRPGDLIGGVIEGTGLPERNPISTFFGNWVWNYDDIPANDWLAIQEVTRERIVRLYEQGVIRYGSW